MKKNHFRPIIVGGPARCGKTSLVTQVGKACKNYFCAPFELLLRVYMWDLAVLGAAARTLVLGEYIDRSRSINADRSKQSAPRDFLSSGERQAVLDMAARDRTMLSGIVVVLNCIAETEKARTWIGNDYHAECDYRMLRRKISGLRLIAVFRDPVEAVCAALYWRTYPSCIENARREMKFRIASWRLAANIALGLRRSFPDDVLIVDSNRLWSGDVSEIDRIAEFIGCSPAALAREITDRPWFSREGQEFFCPDGTFQRLLCEDDIVEIEARTHSLKSVLAANAGAITDGLPASSILQARFPVTARFVLTLRYWPIQRVTRMMSRLKRTVRLYVST